MRNAIVVIVWLASLWAVWDWRAAHCEADKVKPVEQAIEQHNTQVAAIAPVAKATAAKVAKTTAVFNGINQELLKHAQTNPIDGDCSIDADSLRLWRAANANRDLNAPGFGYAEVPGDDTRPCQRKDTGSGGQPCAGDEDLSRVQGSPQRAGRLAGGQK